MNCVFCKIIDGSIPSAKVYEDDKMLIIKDIQPKAKHHYLMLPKKHFAFLADMTAADADLVGYCLKKLGEIKDSLGLENGYRVIINQGENAGQTVFHLHIHVLGGQIMDFPNF